jgi:LAO/AO transport system kinase
VGVGQSESALAGMVDVFALMQLANTGDELQAMKKGVMELADVVVVNKCDLDAAAAAVTARHLETALALLRAASPHWKPPVLQLSALKREGIARFWDEIRCYEQTMKRHAEFDARRRRQALDWMWSLIDSGLRRRFRRHAAVRKHLERLSDAVVRGATSPVAAAGMLLAVSKKEDSA